MSEHDEQVALLDWVNGLKSQYPQLGRLYAIPNGGKRHPRVAAYLKAEGVRAGVLDLCLPVPSRGYHGLYIEMKFGSNKPTKEQALEIESLRKDGYCVPEPCYDWVEAAAAIVYYLKLPENVLPY